MPGSSSRGTAPGIVNRVLFFLFWLGFGCFLRIYFRLRSENRPTLEGAYMLAPNHTSYLDPILLGAVSFRRVTFMMTALHYRSPLMGWFYRWNKAIPVGVRKGNRNALRMAEEVLREGRVLSVFPEGGISRDGKLLLGNPGAVSLALRQGVAVIPVAIDGAHDAFPFGSRFPKPHRITVRFGDPISPDELRSPGSDRKQTLNLATRAIMREIARLSGRVSREDELEEIRQRQKTLPAPSERAASAGA